MILHESPNHAMELTPKAFASRLASRCGIKAEGRLMKDEMKAKCAPGGRRSSFSR